MTDSELREAMVKLRRIAEPVGPTHALWDLIGDIERHLDPSKGKPVLDRARTEAEIERALERAMIWIPHKDGFICGLVGVFPGLFNSWEVWDCRDGEWQERKSLSPFKTIDDAKAAAVAGVTP